MLEVLKVMERERKYFCTSLVVGGSNSEYQRVQHLVEPPSKEEIKFAVKTLKNNKAAVGTASLHNCSKRKVI